MPRLRFALTIFISFMALVGFSQDIDSLKRVVNNPSIHDTLKIQAFKELSSQYLYANPDSAILFGRKMLALSEKESRTKDAYIATARIGQAFEQKGVLDSARVYFAKSLSLRLLSNNTSGIATGYSAMGGLMWSIGKYDSALFYYDQALILHTSLNSEEKMASVFNNKGAVYFLVGDVRNAIDNYYKSMKIDEKLSDLEGVAISKINIGMLYIRIGDYDKATEYLEEAESYYESQSPDQKPLNILDALASIESNKGNLKEAEKLFSDLLLESKKQNNPNQIQSALMNIGVVYGRLKEYDKAVKSYKESIEISREISSVQGLQVALANLGNVYVKMGLLEDAVVVSNEVIELNKTSPSIVEATQAYYTLYKAYKEKGDYSKALQMYEKHNLLDDSLASEKSTRLLTDQEFNYKYEKKAFADSLELAAINQEQLIAEKHKHERKQLKTYFIGGITFFIILLAWIVFRYNTRKKELKKENERVQLEFKSLESDLRALRSQMNPHFIFNALRSIQTYILNEKPDVANEYLLKFSKLIRSVLENSRHNEVPIADDVESLSLYMQLEQIRIKHPFEFEIEIDDSVNVDEDSIPPLILQPFVENTIWHGLNNLDRPGKIKIAFLKSDGYLFCTVEDDGVGREASKNLIKGNSFKYESLGLKITEQRLSVIQQRTRQICSYHISDLKNAAGICLGTRVELKLPLL